MGTRWGFDGAGMGELGGTQGVEVSSRPGVARAMEELASTQ